MSLLLPTTRLVAAGWLVAAVPGFVAAMVGLTRPRDPAKWFQTGFVQVGPVAGGSPNPYVPLRKSVVSVHCWGVNGTQANGPNGPWSWSNKPPWDRTSQLCEQIRAASLTVQYTGSARQVAMLLPGYAHAAVQAAYLLTEPREMLGDVASFAHHQFDLAITWTPEVV